MKKRIFICVLIFSCFSIFCHEDKDVNFTLKTGIGVLTGNVQEYAYTTNVKTNKLDYLSMLNWEIISVPYFYLTYKYDLYKYLSITLNGKLGTSVKSGQMQDYDWQNIVSTGDRGRTNYSIHDNYVDMFWSGDVSIGVNFFISDNFLFTPSVAAGLNYISFSAYDGYAQYCSTIGSMNGNDVFEQPWLDTIPKKYFKGKQITYEQEQSFFAIGFSSIWKLCSLLELDFTFFFSPIMNITSFDHHISRKKWFADVLYSSFFYGDLSFLFNVTKKCLIGLNCEYSIVPEVKGRTYTSSDKQNWGGTSEYFGGTKRHFVQISLVNKFVF